MTDTLLSFPNEVTDIPGWFNSGTPTEILFTSEAYVTVACQMIFQGNATGQRSLVILYTPNGGAAQMVAGATSDSFATPQGWGGNICVDLHVSSGDKVQFQVWQNSTATINVQSGRATVDLIHAA